jgi:branched-chain amino acid transport system permease protein
VLNSGYGQKVLLAGIFLLLIFLPWIVSSQHLMHIFILAGLESIAAMGFVAQYRVRLLTFCTATFWGVGAYASAVFSTKLGINFWFSLPLSGVVAACVALLIGLLVIRAGWVTFLMISVVIAEIFVEAVGHVSFLGGWDGITRIPKPAIGSFVFLSKASYYYLTLGLVVLCVFIFLGFYKSAVGKAWKAIGQSSDLAESVGIDIFQYRMIAYVTAAFTTGLSGSLFAHYFGYISPPTFDIVRSLYVSINAVVGGLGFVISGPIIGSFIIRAIPEWLRITDKYQPIFEGCVIILCALFFRKGIMGVFSTYFAREKSRVTKRSMGADT